MLGSHLQALNLLPGQELNEEKREHAAGTSAGPPPALKLTYLPNLQDALKFHMHTRHKLGYANAKKGYYSYYQSLLPLVNNDKD
eukprot:759578-Pelagomonas_calceolata.AAC.1